MPIIFTTLIIFGLSVGAVLVGLLPAFTEDTARAVNVSQKISEIFMIRIIHDFFFFRLFILWMPEE